MDTYQLVFCTCPTLDVSQQLAYQVVKKNWPPVPILFQD
jgi:hypothetical protein